MANAASGTGYRRRILVVPQDGCVSALLEDDIHSMAVRLRHDGTRVLAVETVLDRMPWNTCPGAATVLVETFAGLALSEVTARRARKANCTHLHGMAVLAASHASDIATIQYDIAVSDPIDQRRQLVLRRDGEPVLAWTEQDGVLFAPVELAGRTLLTLRDWIATLPAESAEAARLLQWGGLVAHGRTVPLEEQSDAARLPANCYTFQPARAKVARRVGRIIDFSATQAVPGEVLERGMGLARG